MIGRLTGQVVVEDADGGVIVDVNGVGYELTVPIGAIGRARALSQQDGVITLHVHTNVREDAITLFGFATPDERSVFRILLGISSVGPKTAVSILSSISIGDLAQAVQSRDVRPLVAVPGVGKKTAERLLLELRDKVPSLAPAATATMTAVAASGRTGPRAQMVVDALARMGFRAAEAERAVASLGDRVEKEPPDATIREALTLLRP